MNDMSKLTDKLIETGMLTEDEFAYLIEHRDQADRERLYERARYLREEHYGKEVYLRGLIEFTNFCKNNCYYCGIRAANKNVCRYRLSLEEILNCARVGYALDFRTFVLQGGEDPYFTGERMTKIIKALKAEFPDCAITLSMGERDRSDYEAWFEAGADRYLLRHETADEKHYGLLHPESLSLKNRKRCLFDLKEIGYQVGSGFMVGSPYQTAQMLARDILFLKELSPEMIGIGPFIPHHDTRFKDQKAGSLELTLFLLAVFRICFPDVLLPATTALGTIDPTGREKGLLAGCNVIMPNISPTAAREKYFLYDNKAGADKEAAAGRDDMIRRAASVGYQVVAARGDHAGSKLRNTGGNLC